MIHDWVIRYNVILLYSSDMMDIIIILVVQHESTFDGSRRPFGVQVLLIGSRSLSVICSQPANFEY